MLVKRCHLCFSTCPCRIVWYIGRQTLYFLPVCNSCMMKHRLYKRKCTIPLYVTFYLRRSNDTIRVDSFLLGTVRTMLPFLRNMLCMVNFCQIGLAVSMTDQVSTERVFWFRSASQLLATVRHAHLWVCS